MALQASRARSLYRRFLRELPARTPSILGNPSPIQQHIRADFESGSSSTGNDNSKTQQRLLEKAEQHVQYLKAQRMYSTLVERYNPGMNMANEDRTKLTARRVGMEMPIEFEQGKKSS